MSILKNKIVESAERMFAERGYEATSIQDIADDCSIAKGSLYKFFPSKEDLYIEIMEVHFARIMEESERIGERTELTPRELFVEEIRHQLDYFFNHGLFVANSLKEKPPISGDKLGPLLFRKRARLLNFNRGVLQRRYGEALEPHVWDAVIILNSIGKEYLHLMKTFAKPLSIPALAAYFADRMDDLVAGLLARKAQPMLPASLMKEFESEQPETLRESIERCGAVILEQAASTIRELSVPNVRKRELEQILELLREEGGKDEPRRFLVTALLNELATEHELAPYAARMRLWAEQVLKA
ncbi:TetR/AcrR family transcriptional regulator [Cohnella cholangitidis]|uniref:TetR/AcrR family transcriptional regulator n=1 Tax=Cohnella cholangitidis TaxID=2598458 RepID=A0A7G5C6C1_9BACL|nr:TetR/AcrR family transcriptional regulator [Cohnella cholangitidis]QMV44755.1 TetR/AcrR family transcriptional regulator [Cohnella cholangitidis]